MCFTFWRARCALVLDEYVIMGPAETLANEPSTDKMETLHKIWRPGQSYTALLICTTVHLVCPIQITGTCWQDMFDMPNEIVELDLKHVKSIKFITSIWIEFFYPYYWLWNLDFIRFQVISLQVICTSFGECRVDRQCAVITYNVDSVDVICNACTLYNNTCNIPSLLHRQAVLTRLAFLDERNSPGRRVTEKAAKIVPMDCRPFYHSFYIAKLLRNWTELLKGVDLIILKGGGLCSHRTAVLKAIM